MNEKRLIGGQVPEEFAQTIEQAARADGRTIASFVRKALREELKRQGHDDPPLATV